MYFITAIEHMNDGINDIPTPCATRTFGYYKDLEIAKERVRINSCDMYECLYNYIVIEKIGEGIHPHVEEEYWFKYNSDTGYWDEIKKPENMKYWCNYSIG